MRHSTTARSWDSRQYEGKQRLRVSRTRRRQILPTAAHRQRGGHSGFAVPFNAPEVWHESARPDRCRFLVEPAGQGYRHAVTVQEIRQRISQLPPQFQRGIEVVQLSGMTRKRALFPCYGMQWGPNVYLYPIEESLVETYVAPPRPEQIIEARMFGGVWSQDGDVWQLTWTEETIKDFYLNNVLIHEIGHLHDERNASVDKRERFANWFAIEYGYRPTRRRVAK